MQVGYVEQVIIHMGESCMWDDIFGLRKVSCVTFHQHISVRPVIVSPIMYIYLFYTLLSLAHVDAFLFFFIFGS